MSGGEVAALRERLERWITLYGNSAVLHATDLRAALALLDAQAADLARLTAERNDLRCSVIAFAGPAAVEYASDYGLPPGHLHATHYDILARAGARMDSFVRAPAPAAEVE